MAKKKKEKVIEQTPEKPIVDEKVEKIKVKKKPKQFEQQEDTIKIDLSKPVEKPKENEVKENNINNEGTVPIIEDTTPVQKQEEVQSEEKTQETPIVEEITDEEKIEEVKEIAETIEEAITESQETGSPLPENIQKLMNFMEDTGGDLTDYVTLNRNYDDLDNDTLLREYYKQTKPHLSEDEIEFIMEDKFSFDVDEDEEKEIKRKKLALKEQVANAKTQLEEHKSKYYEDIKAGSRLTPEAKKAMDFFNRYNRDQEKQKKLNQTTLSNFKRKTDSVFNENFKGFDYKIGDKRFRFNVKDVDGVKETQSNINNFVNKFVGKDNRTIEDAQGYHKSLFTAMNPDTVAKHFYEQGKADAIKDQIAKDKNINTDPRKTHGETNVGGVKYRVLGDSSDDLKLRIKRRKK